MKIVQWSDGRWSLRKFSIIDMRWIYKDLSHTGSHFWWLKNSTFFSDCLVESEEEVRERFLTINQVKKL